MHALMCACTHAHAHIKHVTDGQTDGHGQRHGDAQTSGPHSGSSTAEEAETPKSTTDAFETETKMPHFRSDEDDMEDDDISLERMHQADISRHASASPMVCLAHVYVRASTLFDRLDEGSPITRGMHVYTNVNTHVSKHIFIHMSIHMSVHMSLGMTGMEDDDTSLQEPASGSRGTAPTALQWCTLDFYHPHPLPGLLPSPSSTWVSILPILNLGFYPPHPRPGLLPSPSLCMPQPPPCTLQPPQPFAVALCGHNAARC